MRDRSGDRPDFTIRDEGSILLLAPQNSRAEGWLALHVGFDNGYQPWWPTCIIERRYIGPIVDGITGDDLVIGFA